jgi:hypothetical protein
MAATASCVMAMGVRGTGAANYIPLVCSRKSLVEATLRWGKGVTARVKRGPAQWLANSIESPTQGRASHQE